MHLHRLNNPVKSLYMCTDAISLYYGILIASSPGVTMELRGRSYLYYSWLVLTINTLERLDLLPNKIPVPTFLCMHKKHLKETETMY